MVPPAKHDASESERDFTKLPTPNLQQIVTEASKDMGKRFSLAGLGVAIASTAFLGMEPVVVSDIEAIGRTMIYASGMAGALYQYARFSADWQRRDIASSVLENRGEENRNYHVFIVNPEGADPKVLQTIFFTRMYEVETDKVAETLVLAGKYKGLFSKQRGGCRFTSKEDFVQAVRERVNKAVEAGHILFENEPARKQRHITDCLEEFAKEENLVIAKSLYIPPRLLEPRSYLLSTEVRSYEPKGIEKYVFT